ncbi:MAG: DEAD/DEAH box helicase [Opitutaceae bacterium]|jgi:SNF2 family DNA or RNA helicase
MHRACAGNTSAEQVLDFNRVQQLEAEILRMSQIWTDFDYEKSMWQLPLDEPEEVKALSDWLRGLAGMARLDLSPELAAIAREPITARIELEVKPAKRSEGIDWFDVRACLRSEDTELNAEELRILHAARGSFVKLPRLGWRRMVVSDEETTLRRMEKMGLHSRDIDRKGGYHRLHALHLAGDDDAAQALADRHKAALTARAAALLAAPPPELPQGLSAELRNYQIDGFRRLAFLSANQLGGVLADDMGLGKTLQALAWLLWLGQSRGKGGSIKLKALVVCPKSVVNNWISETGRFAPALSSAALDPRGEGGPVPSSAHLVIANYAQLRIHAKSLCKCSWDAVVLDEAQNIKNPESATSRTARELSALHRMVLTGTPIENKLMDLWSLFAFTMPGLLGSQAWFKQHFQDSEDPAAARRLLASRVKPFLLRRTKAQVAKDLPARIEETVLCDMEDEQRNLYQAELKSARKTLLGIRSESEFGEQRFNILRSLMRLRQICCDPRLIDPKHEGQSSAKIDALLELLEPILAEGHKVLVFSQFVGMLELIRTELRSRSIAHLMLTGATENRHELVLRFTTDPSIQVFLLSLRAAGTGLNLMAASYVVLYDPWWNPAVEAQAIDRTHRIGQKSQVIAYRLLARESVEEKIRTLQMEKREIADAVIEEETLTGSLDLASIRRILE